MTKQEQSAQSCGWLNRINLVRLTGTIAVCGRERLRCPSAQLRNKEPKKDRHMTPNQIQLVQRSFSGIVPIAKQAAAMFYDRLFEIAPQVRAMFPDDMTEQRKKLMATLAVVVNSLS